MTQHHKKTTQIIFYSQHLEQKHYQKNAGLSLNRSSKEYK